ncbi:Lrp/AsnC family transcriptional regulator [Hyphomicrobium sp.]|uniref:Lrp/AsnC family transcriptional regulator n=1 Tax=Hyphomicrobium sp. TaxID=82 RepID=UPI001DDE31F5|nr:Lrp/AsnC family transcriptional regulator [Hyphomicrobium sp.]MBY0558813.1 Lrp/AsnC family transcriptional regulator [Hyphomicrobium sp.]
MSDLDRQIITHLQEDGRRAFVTIARAVGVTEKTVRTRVRQLLGSNIIRIVALTMPSAIGYNAGALVAINVESSAQITDVARALAGVDDVDYVVSTSGRYDILAELVSPSRQTLLETFHTKVRGIDGIARVELFPYFSFYYQQAAFFTQPKAAKGLSSAHGEQLDLLDRSIAVELSHNGRAPLKNVAQNVGMSETQVRARIQNMASAGTMTIMAIVNPMNLPNSAMAWLAIKANGNSSLRSLARDMAEIPYISYVVICAGRFDIFAEIVCPSTEALLATIDNKVRDNPNVRSVEANFCFDLHYKPVIPMNGYGTDRSTGTVELPDDLDDVQHEQDNSCE